jgi:hypothetical protein
MLKQILQLSANKFIVLKTFKTVLLYLRIVYNNMLKPSVMTKYKILFLLFNAGVMLSCDDDKGVEPVYECYISGIKEETDSEITTIDYFFDDNHKLNKVSTIIDYKNGDPQIFWEVRYNYNDQGKVSRVTTVQQFGDTSSYKTFEYNEQQLLVKISEFRAEDDFVNKRYWTYEYNNGFELKQSFEHIIADGGETQSVTTYTYTNGLMSTVTNENYTLTYEYDGKHSSFELVNYLPEFIDTYPNKSNVTKFVYKNSLGDIVQGSSYNAIYQYNKQDFATQKKETYLDGKVITYTYIYPCV